MNDDEFTDEELMQARRPPVEPRYGADVHVTDGPQTIEEDE